MTASGSPRLGPLGRAWDRFWFGEGSLVRLGVYRILLMALALVDVTNYRYVVFADANKANPEATWNPLLLAQLAGLEPLSPEAVQVLYTALLIVIPLALVGIASRFTTAAAGLLLLFYSVLAYSHGKPHHDKVAYTFATLALCLGPVGARCSIDSLLARARRARRGEDPGSAPERAPFALLPIRIAQVAVALGYFYAGATKLVVSGLGWANGWSLMGILMGHDNWASAWMASRPALLALLSIATLAVQFTFPVGMLLGRLKWLWVLGGTAFHLSTWVTMDTGPYTTLWFLVWIAFLPFERLGAWSRRAARERPWLLALVLVPIAFAAWVMSLTVPWPWFLPAIFPALALLPQSAAVVVYDGTCGLCRRTVAVLAGLDWGDRLVLRDFRRAETLLEHHPDIDPVAAERDMHVVTGSGTTAGFEGYRRLVPRLPLLMPLTPVLGLPPVAWLGRRVYRFVADRRLRRGCGDEGCPVHPR